jgi:hypothetical protein
MHGTQRFLEQVHNHRLASGHLRGVFHIAIGRKVTDPDGNVVSSGVTWRELAVLLKEAKYDRELVRELGADPDTLSPKDREKFWYAAVTLAKVDGPEARQQADALIALLKPHGLIVGPPPGPPPKTPLTPPIPADKTADDDTYEQAALPASPVKKKKK